MPTPTGTENTTALDVDKIGETANGANVEGSIAITKKAIN